MTILLIWIREPGFSISGHIVGMGAKKRNRPIWQIRCGEVHIVVRPVYVATRSSEEILPQHPGPVYGVTSHQTHTPICLKYPRKTTCVEKSWNYRVSCIRFLIYNIHKRYTQGWYQMQQKAEISFRKRYREFPRQTLIPPSWLDKVVGKEREWVKVTTSHKFNYLSGIIKP